MTKMKNDWFEKALDFVKTGAAVLGFVLLLLGMARGQSALTSAGNSTAQAGLQTAFAVGQVVGGPVYTPTASVVQGVIQPGARMISVRPPSVPAPEFRVFPNPTSDAVFVVCSEAQAFWVALYDLEGKAAHSTLEGVFNPHEPLRIGVADLPDGVYLLKIETTSRRAVYKILVAD
ncbi:MAG: T9SS type A sorting domain-containing protein [Bacteroidia bacterium]|nr:T9SS type A sorting domain-containing protein [Bacteroidia bacterium]MDW8333283.1 T9SS type A sorting domain-containing protein [Bacteroidia bacterium]